LQSRKNPEESISKYLRGICLFNYIDKRKPLSKQIWTEYKTISDNYEKSDNKYNEEEEEETESVRMDGEEWLDDDGTFHIDYGMDCNNCRRNWTINVRVHPTMNEKQGASKLTFKVPSKSGGEDHEVEVFNGEYKCDCVSFKTRKKCSHIDKVKKDMEKKDEGN
jgi:hypothetical protein